MKINSKSEARNTKQYLNPNFQNSKLTSECFADFGFWSLGFVSDLEIRNSDFTEGKIWPF